MRCSFRPLFLCLLTTATPEAARAEKESLEVAVVSQLAPAYRRELLPNGSFKPERYALANGGKIAGSTTDSSTEQISFPLLAGVVGRHLAAQRYFLAQKADDADLLIVVHWGATVPYDMTHYGMSVGHAATAMSAFNRLQGNVQAMQQGSLSGNPDDLRGDLARAAGEMESMMMMIALENRSRDMANLGNAKLLGYLDAINQRREVEWTSFSGTERDLYRDLEAKRYYVVVSAYDFPTLRKKKQQVLRWVTRISIDAQGNDFAERMAQMVASAASSFGQRRELQRRFHGDPRVELGETRFLGIAAPPAPDAGENDPAGK